MLLVVGVLFLMTESLEVVIVIVFVMMTVVMLLVVDYSCLLLVSLG